MIRILTGLGCAAALLASGCASITGDTVQSIRVETQLPDGSEVRDADCELTNKYGAVRVKTPGSVMVRRSSTDLYVTCRKEPNLEAKGTATSRVNAGMYGNIIFGGAVGAVIDHTKGTAYTYPQWLQLVIGKLFAFDRRHEHDGQPSPRREIGSIGPIDPMRGNAPTSSEPRDTTTSAVSSAADQDKGPSY